MATSLNVIRTLTIRAKAEGVEQAASSMDKLAKANDNVASSASKTEKATLSEEAAFKRLERSLDPAARAAEQLARAQKQLDDAHARGRISLQRHNELLQIARDRYSTAGQGASVAARAFGEVGSAVTATAASLGTAGSVLAALGPVGIAVGAVLATLTLGFGLAAKAALDFADEMGRLVDTADTIGLTVEQLRALQLAAAQVGIGQEQLAGLLGKFSVSLEKVREGAEGSADAFNRLQPGLADSVRNAKTMDEAFSLVAKAMSTAEASAARLAAREIFGKEGLAALRLAGVDINKLVEGMNEVDLNATKMARSIDAVGDSIKENFSLAATNIKSTFALPVLDVLDEVSKIVLELSRSFAKAFGTDLGGLLDPVIAALQEFRAQVMTLNQDITTLGTNQALQNLGERLFGSQVTAAISLFIQALTTVAQHVVDLISLFGSLGTAIVRAFSFNFSGVQAALADAQATALGMANRLIDLGNAAATAAPKIAGVGDAVENTSQETSQANLEWNRYLIGQNNAITAGERFIQGQAKVAPSLGKSTSAVKDNTKALKDNNDVMKELGQAAGQLGSALVSAFLKGESAGKALKTTLQSIASSATGSAINNLVTGNFGGAAISGGIALGAGLLSFLFGDDEEDRRNQEEVARQQAESAALVKRVTEAWADLADELEAFDRQAQGITEGTLRAAIDAWNEQAASLGAAAAAAGDAAGFARVVAIQMQGLTRILTEFGKQVDIAIEEFGGEGLILQARANVKSLMDDFKSLTQDIIVFGEQTGDAVGMMERLGRLNEKGVEAFLNMLDISEPLSDVQVQIKGLTATAGALVDALVELGLSAEEAALKVNQGLVVALSELVDVSEPLSEIRTRFADIMSVVEPLTEALLNLGYSAEQAAAIVNERLNPALTGVVNDFLDPLIRSINEFVGGGWINEAQDLMAQVAQLRADAIAMGIQTTLIDTFYVIEAQKIINSNELVGDSFRQLEALLGLAGQGLHESSQAVEDTTDVVVRSAQEIADAIQANEDRLFLAIHRSDSLADQLARFDLAAQREREREIAAGGQALASLERALARERLNIIQDFLDEQRRQAQEAADRAAEEAERARQEQIEAARRAAEERKRLLDEAREFIQGQIRRIKDWIANFLSGPQSILPPSQQLATAQSHFASELSAAASGNRDALSGITTNAQNVVDAVRRYYGSAPQGQTIIQQLLAQLNALPSQLSPEEFIVEGLSTPIRAIPPAVTGPIVDGIDDQTSVLQILLQNLRTAVQTGDAQATAIALLPLFEDLDTTMDKALSFDEFKAGLGTTFSTGTLRNIFNELDGNGNGLLEKSELIKVATQGTKGDTGKIEDNTLTMSQQLVALNAMVDWLRSIATGISNTYTLLGRVEVDIDAMAHWTAGSSHALGGPLSGRSHAQGGIHLVAEGGEYIINKRDARWARPLLDAINYGHGLPGMGGPANDNGGMSVIAAIGKLERTLLRGIKALIETELEAAGMVARPLDESNKLTRTRRGEKKKIA